METKPIVKEDKKSGGAAAKKTYSAEELAEVFMTARPDFYNINLAEITLNWNPNYIFDFLKCIDDLSDLEDIISWFILKWEDNHNYMETMDNIYSNELVEEHRVFCDHLQRFKEVQIKRKENREKMAALAAKWLNSPRHNTATMNIQPATATRAATQTEQPDFKPPQQVPDENKREFIILLTDLPKDIQDIVVVSQKVFNVFVRQLNEDLWSIVETNKSLYCDPLRFLCNFHYITKRETSREEFDKLLHAIVEKLQGEPSLVSSMGRCKLTSENKISRSYKCYACYKEIPKMREEIWQLIEPCTKLEESLQPVLDEMKNEEEAKKQLSSINAQPSSTV